MAKRATSIDLSPSESNENISLTDDHQGKSQQTTANKNSIKSYVADLLTKYGSDNGQPIDLSQTQVEINTKPGNFREYENVSAFRSYPLDAAAATGARTPKSERKSPNNGGDRRNHRSTERVKENIIFLF